jgi:hypothetical protein
MFHHDPPLPSAAGRAAVTTAGQTYVKGGCRRCGDHLKVCTAMADRADQKLGARERRISKLAAAAGLIAGPAELPIDRTRLEPPEQARSRRAS